MTAQDFTNVFLQGVVDRLRAATLRADAVGRLGGPWMAVQLLQGARGLLVLGEVVHIGVALGDWRIQG